MQWILLVLVIINSSRGIPPPLSTSPVPIFTTASLPNATTSTALASPSAPNLVSRTTSTLSITWIGTGSYYTVQYGVLGGLLTNSMTNGTSATINGLTPGQSYHVTVIAYSGVPYAAGAAGSNATFTTIPSAPLNFTATANGQYIRLEWDYADGDIVNDFGVWCTPYINAYGDSEWSSIGNRFSRSFRILNSYYGMEYNISVRAQSGANGASDAFSDNVTQQVATEAAQVYLKIGRENREYAALMFDLPLSTRTSGFRYYWNSTNGGRSNYSDTQGYHYYAIYTLESGYNYMFSAVSFAEYGAMSAQSNLINYTAYPSSVIGLNLRNSTSSSLTFTWNFTGKFDDFDYNLSPDVWNSTGVLMNTSDVYELTYNNLSAGTSHTLQVRTKVTDIAQPGQYKYSRFSSTTSLTDELSPTQVRNLTVTNVTDSSISISWESPEQENGVVIGYVLQAIPVNDTNNICVQSVFFNCTDCQRRAYNYSSTVMDSTTQCDTQDLEVDFNSTSSLYYAFDNLTVFTRYEIKVFAINTKPPSVASINVTTVPSEKPEVTVEFITHQSVSISWTRVSDKYGSILGYYVSAVEAATGLVKVTTQIPSTDLLKFTLTPLTPYTEYKIHVLAYTRRGNGTSGDIEVTTSQYTPAAPHDLSVKPDARKLTVSWKVPSTQNGVIQSYNIRVTNSTATLYDRNTRATTVDITDGIKPYTLYTVLVKTRTLYPEWGDAANSGPIRSLQSNPTGIPKNFRTVGQTSSSVMLSWEEIDKELRNGVIQGYTLSYNTSNRTVYKELDKDARQLNVANLTRSTLYKFSLLGYVHVGFWRTVGPEATLYVATTDIECTEAPYIENTEVSSVSARTKNSTINYSCKKGYTAMSGDNTLTCTEVNGEAVWIGAQLSCEQHMSQGSVAAIIVVSILVVLAISIAVVCSIRMYKKSWNRTNADTDTLPLSIAADYGDPQTSPVAA